MLILIEEINMTASESSEKRIGVFADDEPYLARIDYLPAFEDFSDFQSVIVDADIAEQLEEQLDEIDLKRVDLLIVDQYKHERGLRDVMGSFILNLRDVNSGVWIVETSFQQQPNVYKGSNSIQSIGSMRMIFREARQLDGTANRRVEHIVGQTSSILQRAREAQNVLVGLNEDKEIELEGYLQEAIRERKAKALFTALNLGLVQFVEKVQSLDLNQKSQVMHDTFHMLHHLERGSDETVYGNTLAKIQQILQL